MGPSRVIDNNRGISYDYITDEIYGLISDLGINLINASANNYASVGSRDAIIEALQMGERYNIDFYVMDARLAGNLSEAQVRNYMKDYSSYSAFKGINVVDEPSSGSYPAGSTGTMSNYATVSTILNNMEGVTGYGNLLPWYRYLGTEVAYRSYVNEYIQTCHPQVLSFDNYPFDDNAFASRKAYVSNLGVIRDIALQYHIPFWSFVQAGSNWNNDASDMAPTTNDSPTEAELRWSVNASLAYGAQGIEYFPLIQPYWFAYEENGGYDYARNGLIGANGEKTQWYDYAKQINQQVYSVGEVLMEAKSVDLLAFGTQAIADTGISKKSYGVLSGVQTTGNVIVGCFEYYGKDVFYVVNHNVTGTQNLTLQFAKNVNYSVISDQITESLQGNMAGTSCNLTLNAGGAALIMVD